MDAFQWTILLEVIFVVTAMAYIGMSVTWHQVRNLLEERGLVGRALIANLVLTPLLGLLLVAIFPMPVDAQVAILLVAAAPGGLNVVQFTTKIGGRLAHAAALLFVLSMISLVSTPLVLLLMPLPREPGAVTALWNIVAFLAAVLAPMGLGALVRRTVPAVAQKLARPINLVSTVAFVAAMIVGNSIRKEAAEVISGRVLLVLVLFVAGTLLIGWLMGGRDRADRQLLATATSIRNAGLVLLFAITLFPYSGVDNVVLAYMLVMIPPNAAITIASLARERRKQHKADKTPQH